MRNPVKRDRVERQAFSAIPPLQGLFWTAIGHFYGNKWGCSSDSLRHHRKHSATEVVRQVSRDRGGCFGRVAKGLVTGGPLPKKPVKNWKSFHQPLTLCCLRTRSPKILRIKCPHSWVISSISFGEPSCQRSVPKVFFLGGGEGG